MRIFILSLLLVSASIPAQAARPRWRNSSCKSCASMPVVGRETYSTSGPAVVHSERVVPAESYAVESRPLVVEQRQGIIPGIVGGCKDGKCSLRK